MENGTTLTHTHQGEPTKEAPLSYGEKLKLMKIKNGPKDTTTLIPTKKVLEVE